MSKFEEYKEIHSLHIDRLSRKEEYLVDATTEFRKSDPTFENTSIVASYHEADSALFTDMKHMNAFLKAAVWAHQNQMGLRVTPFDIYNLLLSGLHLYISNFLTYEEKDELVQNIEEETKLVADELGLSSLNSMLYLLKGEVVEPLQSLYDICFEHGNAIQEIAIKIRLTASQLVVDKELPELKQGSLEQIEMLVSNDWERLADFIEVVNRLFPLLQTWTSRLTEFFTNDVSQFMNIFYMDGEAFIEGSIVKLFPILCDEHGNFYRSNLEVAKLRDVPFTVPNIPVWKDDALYDLFLSDTCITFDRSTVGASYGIVVVDGFYKDETVE